MCFRAQQSELSVVLALADGQSVGGDDITAAVRVFAQIVHPLFNKPFVHGFDFGDDVLRDDEGSAILGDDLQFPGVLSNDPGNNFLSVVFGDREIHFGRVDALGGGFFLVLALVLARCSMGTKQGNKKQEGVKELGHGVDLGDTKFVHSKVVHNPLKRYTKPWT